MVQGVGDFVPFGAPRSPVQRVDPRALADLLGAAPKPSDDALVDLLQRSFGVTLLDALKKSGKLNALPPAAAPAPAAAPTAAPPRGDTAATETGTMAAPAATSTTPTAPAARPTRAEEDATIRRIAERTGVDARFLSALRRAENGGPGREFGVLSVPAPTYDDQARVAAETVRRNIARFESTGGEAIDPASGRYSEEFIRFFSSRYAPVGAANDPQHLNQYHARNLIRLYAQLAPKDTSPGG